MPKIGQGSRRNFMNDSVLRTDPKRTQSVRRMGDVQDLPNPGARRFCTKQERAADLDATPEQAMI
jgi:hypothetical protein